jgi:hypothetical protein
MARSVQKVGYQCSRGCSSSGKARAVGRIGKRRNSALYGRWVVEPREVVCAHRVRVPGEVEPVPAVERGEIGRRANQLILLRKAKI